MKAEVTSEEQLTLPIFYFNVELDLVKRSFGGFAGL